MKNTLKRCFLVCLALFACVLIFTACEEGTLPNNGNSEPEAPETEAHVHAFGEWTVTIEPTCTAKGSQTRVCYCGEDEAEEIAMLEHTPEEISAVDATCTETGLTAGSRCSVCEAILVEQEVVEIVAHTPVTDHAMTPTCTMEGWTEGSHCGVCNAVLVAQTEIAKLAHTWITDPAIEPTCANYGRTEGSHCRYCAKVNVAQIRIDKLPHETEAVEGYAATCTQSGLTNGTKCTVCKNTVIAQQTIPALDHAFNKETNTCIRCPETELPEICSRNDLEAYDGKTNAVILLDKCMTTSNYSEDWTQIIHPDATHVRLVGTEGVIYNLRLVVEKTRAEKLTIELVNVTLKTSQKHPTIEIKDAGDVEIAFYGSTCAVLGRNGDKGANGALLNLSYSGENGDNGYLAIKSAGAVSLKASSSTQVEIRGGNGGNGGNGMDAGLAPQNGGNGGKGGNGTFAIEASSIDVYGNSFTLLGGNGGNGGSGGEGFPFFSDGKTGKNGSSSVATTITPTYH